LEEIKITETQTTNINDYRRQVTEWSGGVVAFYQQVLDLMPEEMRQRILELKRTETALEEKGYVMIREDQPEYEESFKLVEGIGRLETDGAYDGYRYLADKVESQEKVRERLRDLSERILPSEYLEPREEGD